MTQDLHLFIGDEEVEFSANPQILWNSTLKDFQNPTIVKNSFSKSLEIPSTPANDNIFNHYWNLERYYDNNLSFNALRKAPFQLFFQGALIEKGYCKLDKIKKANHNHTYSVSLFGGLGEFFYNLSYDSTEGGDNKKNLASLSFITDAIKSEPDLNFYINKEEVKNAWDGIMGYGVYDDRWNVLNFAPAYNGIPNDFAAETCLINYNGIDLFDDEILNDGTVYRTVNGFALGQSQESLTEWQTFDLRSYLQRPVVSVKRTLEAIFQPENNGGYQVKLDSHFFNNDNPYWTDGWVTLPMLRDLEIKGGESETIYGGSLSYDRGMFWVKYYNFSYPSPSLVSINNTKIKLQVRFTPQGGASSSTLYGYRNLKINTGLHIFDGHRYVKNMTENTAVIIQLQALSHSGEVVAMSDAYCLGGSSKLPGSSASIWDKYTAEDGLDDTKYHFIAGKWVSNGGSYVFADGAGNPVEIAFNLNNDANFASLRMKVQTPTGRYTKFAWSGSDSVLDSPTTAQGYSPLYLSASATATGDYTPIQAQAIERVLGQFTYAITEFEMTATDYEALFSNTYIPKNKILGTEYSPAEFLLSYAKMFGLYFYRDPAETADDETLAPNGVIHIMDRNTFYDEEHIDIEKRIDRGKDMVITPINAGSKWYEFAQEQIESEADNVYTDNFGFSYGRQLVNTNYNFNSDTTNLYDGNAFKAGIMVREKDKYYYQPIDGVPFYVWNGFSYFLFHSGETYETEMEVTRHRNKFAINTLNLSGYDCMPKLQCHTEENSPSDGSGVLLFYKGLVNTLGEGGLVNYWLTDDLQAMADINEESPCWIMTNDEYDTLGNRIAYKYNILPQFTRDMINFGLQEGNIVNSWNFGHPMATYVPNTYTIQGDSIYDKCWKNYIKDVYDQNTKVVDCYVRLPRYAHPSLFRKWWHFDNGIWALNSVKDWNAGSDEPVKCTFIKVQDTENYSLQQINGTGEEHFVIDTYEIGCSGGTISGTIYLQSGGHWYSRNDTGMAKVTDANGVVSYVNGVLSPYQGQGTTSYVTLTIPANTGDTALVWEVAVIDDFDNWLTVSLTQYSCGSSLAFVPSTYRRNASGGTMMLTFEAENMVMPSLSVSKDASWLGTPTISGDSRVIITNERNDTTSQRIGYVTLEGYGYNGRQYSASAAIVQAGQEYEPGWIEFSNTALTIPYQSGTTDESFTYGGSLEMSDLRVYGGDGWATPRIVSATSEVFVDYTENAGASARTAYITIYGYDKLGIRRTAYLQLTQNAQPQQTIFVSPTEINLTYANVYGDNLTITGTTGDYNITITDNA